MDAESTAKKKFEKNWIEYLFTNFSMPMLLAACVQYGYGTGEELYDYLTSQLGMSEGGAEMVVSKLNEIDL